MNDIVITKIIEPDRTVVALAGDGYVAAEVDYQDLKAGKSTVPDAVVLLSLAGVERMMYALGSAALKARELAAFIASASKDESL